MRDYDSPRFSAYHLCWSSTLSAWTLEEKEMPFESMLLFSQGSGSSQFECNYVKYSKCVEDRTSRGLYHCFIKTLEDFEESNDPYCGGSPQLAGIFRGSSFFAEDFGVIYKDELYVYGEKLDKIPNSLILHWRNSRFEICNPTTKRKLSDAVSQPDLIR